MIITALGLSKASLLIMETAALRRYFAGTGAVTGDLYEDIKYAPYTDDGPYEIHLKLRNVNNLDKIIPDLQELYHSKLVVEWI